MIADPGQITNPDFTSGFVHYIWRYTRAGWSPCSFFEFNSIDRLMKSFPYRWSYLVTVWVLFSVTACNGHEKESKELPQPNLKIKARSIKKPPSTYPDTLTVSMPSAVFYHPDSLQLAKIKAESDSSVFDGSMHEYYYQMRNARMVIKKTWSELSIIESKNYRFVLFISKNKSTYCVDLDEKTDPYGMIVFNGKKPPLFVDMMNIETEVSFYLNN